jgi:hypothetical protein
MSWRRTTSRTGALHPACDDGWDHAKQAVSHSDADEAEELKATPEDRPDLDPVEDDIRRNRRRTKSERLSLRILCSGDPPPRDDRTK